MTIQEAAQTTLDIQNAVSVSGVLGTFHEIVSGPIWEEAHHQQKGTQFVNTHPIVTLFLDKLCDLNSCTYDVAKYTDALIAVTALSRSENVSWKEVQS